MPASTISKRAVDATVPADRDVFLWDDRLRGFGLKVTPTGAKIYIVQYRIGGRGTPTRRITIGKHGSPWTPDLARRKAKQLLGEVAAGRDPAGEKRPKPNHADTFESVAAEFVERYVRRHHRRWRETEQAVQNKLVAHWRHRQIASIGRRDVLDLLDREMDAGRPRTANKTLTLVRKLFNWAVERGIVEASPVTGIRAPGREITRDRVLSDDELVAIWNAAGRMGWPWTGFIQLLITTAQRRDEVSQMPWSEVDLERRLWTIPAERTKAERVHDVPLSDLALSIISDLPRIGVSGLVFPANRTGSTNAISGFSRMKRRLDQLSGVEGWRLHDLRRSAASRMAQLGHPPHVVGGILNHTPGSTMGISAIYVRHRFTDERRAALDAWARHLERITTGTTADVVALSARR
jgi:integrase